MLQYRLDNSADVSFALINAGGVRATIDQGPITRGEVLTAFPFGNAVIELKYSGDELWKIIEGLVSKKHQTSGKDITSWFQVSKGIKIEYNPSNDVGKKLVAVTIGGKALDRTKQYTIVTIDFLAGGGDSFFVPVSDFVVLDTLDEVLVKYIQSKSPVDFKLEGRISVVTGSATTSGTPTGTASTTPTPTNDAGRLGGVGSSVALLVFTIMLGVVVGA